MTGGRRKFGWPRLLLALLFLALALWVLLPAQNRTSFYAVLLVTEFGWLLVPLGVLWLWRFRRRRAGTVAMLLAWLATVLLFIPIMSVLKLYQQHDFRELDTQALTAPVVTEMAAPYGLTHQLYQSGDAVGTVMLIHGGGWRSGSPEMVNHWRNWWLKRGFNVVMANHRKAPEHVYPAQQEDIANLLLVLHEQLTKQYGSEHKFLIQGHSSGGHLALLTAYAYRKLVDGVIAFYPPTDLVTGYQTGDSPILDIQGLLEQFLGGSLESMPKRYTDASPLNIATALLERELQLPPVLLLHGRRDAWVESDQTRRLAKVLGPAAEVYELPFADHAFDFNSWGLHAQFAQDAIENFVAGMLVDDE